MKKRKPTRGSDSLVIVMFGKYKKKKKKKDGLSLHESLNSAY